MTADSTRIAPVSAPAPADDVEARLLAAALRLFGQRGYAAVSVREVARAAGVTTPAVYYYFTNKRGLYLRVLHDLLERRTTAMRTALSGGGDPLARLHRALEGYAAFDQDNPVDNDAHLLILRETFGLGTDMFPDLIAEHDASNRRLIRQVLEDGIRCGVFRKVRVEHTVIAILGIMSTFMRRAALGARVRPADGIAQVMDVVVEGLRTRAPRAGADHGGPAVAGDTAASSGRQK